MCKVYKNNINLFHEENRKSYRYKNNIISLVLYKLLASIYINWNIIINYLTLLIYNYCCDVFIIIKSNE